MMARLGRRTSALRWPLATTLATVELLLVLAALAREPARIDARAAWFAGPLGPLVVPVGVLPPAARAERLLAERRLPLGERVATALAWGADTAALRAAAGHAGALNADHALDDALERWAAAAAGQLGLPREGGVVVVGPDGRARHGGNEERAALAEVQELLAPLAWPRWRGPLLLVPYGIDHPAIAPGVARVVRPALPVLRLPAGGRPGLAVAIAELALALAAPPPAGWPDWLTLGVAGCARARADGSGLPERRLAEQRAAAGAGAVARLLAGDGPADAALATAVVGGLLQPRRRARLSELLELLRHGAGGTGAVATAYGLSPEQLAAAPGDAPPER
jgi:hypothetical protein